MSPTTSFHFGGLGALEGLEARLAPAAVDVLNYHDDISGTGQNLNETVLTPANVNAATFGKVFTTPVDGLVYAQPLYVPNLAIAGPNYVAWVVISAAVAWILLRG